MMLQEVLDMRRMGVDPEMRLASALDLFPEIYPGLLAAGLCCVSKENESLSLGQIAASLGLEPEDLADRLNSLI